MKKIVLILTLTAFTAVAFTSCKKKAADCTALITKINEAFTAYSTNANTANCQALKTAYNNMLGCGTITAAQKTQYEQAKAAINSLCP